MRSKALLLFGCLFLTNACGEDRDKLPPDSTNPKDAGGGNPPGDLTATIALCRVELTFNLTRNEVTFRNQNDGTVQVTVTDDQSHGLVVKKRLTNDATATETATLSRGLPITVLVEQWTWTTDFWRECDRRSYTLP